MGFEEDKKISEWAINKIKTEYPNDVALLIGHGFDKLEQVAPGDTLRQYKGEFDYFVPDTERAYNLSQSFIVDGIGYDLYPRSWESVASMADLDDCHTSCLADANVLYARSETDRNRFEALRQRLLDNLHNKRYAYEKAQDRLSMAVEIYQTLVFSDKVYEVRASSGFILDYLAQAVAFINGSYFKRGSLYQLEEMVDFNEVPPSFEGYYKAITGAGSASEIKRLCQHIIYQTKKFLRHHKPESVRTHKPDFHGLADWYQELGHSWGKIYSCCDHGDTTRVFFWGCSLQHELDIIREEFELEEMDLMGSYNSEDLSAIRVRAEEIEKYITDTIVKNSVSIAIFRTVEDFLQRN